jgi:hypothetical protein
MQEWDARGIGSGDLLIDKLSVTSTVACGVVVEQESFKQLAEYFAHAKLIIAKLSECQDKSVEKVVEFFIADVQRAEQAINTWTNKSCIYLLPIANHKRAQ